MTNRPDRYFKTAAKLYRAVRLPNMAALSLQRLTGQDFAVAFVQQNPGLRPEMVRLKTDRAGWLQEVRLCLARNLRPRPCPLGEPGAPDARPLRIWRG